MRDTSLFTVSQDSIALSGTQPLSYHAFGSPRILESQMSRGGTKWKLLSKTAGPDPVRRFRRLVGHIFWNLQRGTRTWARGANGRTRSRTTNLPVAAVRCCLVARKDTRIIYTHAATLILDSKTLRCDVTARINYSQLLERFSLQVTVYSFRKLSRGTVTTFPWQTPDARISKYLPPKAGRPLPSATAIKSYCFCDALASL